MKAEERTAAQVFSCRLTGLPRDLGFVKERQRIKEWKRTPAHWNIKYTKCDKQ